MRAPVATAIAMGVGIIVLLGYFLNIPALQNIRSVLIGWGVILAAVAALVGVINLFITHIRKMTAPARMGRDLGSIFFILAFIVTLGFGLWLTPGDPQFQQAVMSIQMPIETSLMALLAVSIVYGCLRLVQQRKAWFTWVFLVSVILFLLLNSGLLGFFRTIPGLDGLLTFVDQIPLAGARGILMGIALGSLVAGLRIISGSDRPYSG